MFFFTIYSLPLLSNGTFKLHSFICFLALSLSFLCYFKPQVLIFETPGNRFSVLNVNHFLFARPIVHAGLHGLTSQYASPYFPSMMLVCKWILRGLFVANLKRPDAVILCVHEGCLIFMTLVVIRAFCFFIQIQQPENYFLKLICLKNLLFSD